MMATMALFTRLSNTNEPPKGIEELVDRRCAGLYGQCGEVVTRLRSHDYPLKSAVESMTIGDYVMPRLPNPDDPNDILETAVQAQRRARELYIQVMSRLALMTEQTEKAMGFPPLDLGEWSFPSE